MRIPQSVAIALLIMGSAGASLAAVPACNPAEVEKLPSTYGFKRLSGPAIGTISYPFGSRKGYGFDVSLVIDAEGRVTCAAVTDETRPFGPGIFDDQAPPEVTPQRQAALDTLAAGRYKPFESGGQAVAAHVTAFFEEEQLPRYHVAPPQGALSGAHIHQEYRADMVPYPSYDLDIHGDGRVVYTADDDALIGTQTYFISPAEVQALLDAAAEADFWSYEDAAMRSPVQLAHSWMRGTTITLGGRANSLGFESSFFGGEPEKFGDLQRAIDKAAHVEWWYTFPPQALEHLRANGFDFKGRPGSDLLARGLGSRDVPDSTIQEILRLGAPVMWSQPAYDGRVSSPLTAALENRKTELARSMIDAGALLVDGHADRARVNSAFIAALAGGHMAPVQWLLAYDPDMMAPDMLEGRKRLSVIFWLARGGEKPDAAAIAELLIARGAPVAARDARGRSVLSFAAETGQAAIVRVLLAHGASPDAIDISDKPSLGGVRDEDIALLLLDAGADPRKLSGGYDTAFYRSIKWGSWTRVVAWLEAHGYSEWLAKTKAAYEGA